MCYILASMKSGVGGFCAVIGILLSLHAAYSAAQREFMISLLTYFNIFCDDCDLLTSHLLNVVFVVICSSL